MCKNCFNIILFDFDAVTSMKPSILYGVRCLFTNTDLIDIIFKIEVLASQYFIVN